MPLQDVNLVAIPVLAAARTFGAAIAGAGTPANPLPVPFHSQDGDNWCWAACAKMGAEYHGKGPGTQCDIASTNLGDSTCCPAVRGGHCDVDNSVPGITQCWMEQYLASNPVASHILWQDLCDEIDAGRFIEVGWEYAGGSSGHVLLAIGYRVVNDEDWVILNDSAKSHGGTDMTYSELLTAGNTGTWTDSWTDVQ